MCFSVFCSSISQRLTHLLQNGPSDRVYPNAKVTAQPIAFAFSPRGIPPSYSPGFLLSVYTHPGSLTTQFYDGFQVQDMRGGRTLRDLLFGSFTRGRTRPGEVEIRWSQRRHSSLMKPRSPPTCLLGWCLLPVPASSSTHGLFFPRQNIMSAGPYVSFPINLTLMMAGTTFWRLYLCGLVTGMPFLACYISTHLS